MVLLGLAAGGCGSGSGEGGFGGSVGEELDKPGGGTFFLDEHRGGQASRVHLVDISWGRLVDVHQLDAAGAPDPMPVFRDMVIQENVQTDDVDYVLEINVITQATRLVILRRKGEPDQGGGTFEDLLAEAVAGLPPIVPKNDDGSASPPFSLVARNACLQLRFDDLLEDGAAGRAALAEAVKIITGYPPRQPFSARLIFDPNHGGLAGNAFHTTRVLVDLTVSEEERAASEIPLEVNLVGLPASLVGQSATNVSIRIPTREDPGSGQFELLTNLAGSALDTRNNGPVDDVAPTRDVVRAMRSGRVDDANNGVLLDLNKPEVLGSWPLEIDAAAPVPGGMEGHEFLVDLTFTTPCRGALAPPGIVQSGERFLEVLEPSGLPSPDGQVSGVRLRLRADEPLQDPNLLVGGALYLSTFARTASVPAGCWFSFLPRPGDPPVAGVNPSCQLLARFSEPMDPSSVDPFENFRMVRGDSSTLLLPTNLVIARVSASVDLREFSLTPLLPLAFGFAGEYHFRLGGEEQGVTDLAANPLADVPPAVDFTLDPGAPVSVNGGTSLRFSSLDEVDPIARDVRGQVFYDLLVGKLLPRPVTTGAFPADRTQPVPSIMIPFSLGVQTPLSALGSKLQTLWRYCDLGWQVSDETKHNVDVIGLAWSPVGGQVLSDFYDQFEIRLSHSRRLPDETRTPVGANWPCSGLGSGATTCPPCLTNVPFDDNILLDPRSPQKVVHDRALGYRIHPSDLFISFTGTPFVPFPLNRSGGPLSSYTWRDTAVLEKDGRDSPGIPLQVETSLPLLLEPPPFGRIAVGGLVPSYGLPLLVEIRCFPSSSGVGLNPLDVSLAMNAQQLPNFRAYSTGGVNTAGQRVLVNPDLALIPQGGFNPGSVPPGKPTAFEADNSYYIGHVDTITRVSRAHTVWIDVLFPSPRYAVPVVSPSPEAQPAGTRVLLEFRGATAFTGQAETAAFDAQQLDPYGDVDGGGVMFLDGDDTWKQDPRALDGARFLQMRFSFENNIESGLTPELSAVGIAYSAD